MPTGYTARVESGEITELKDFAMLCARAMGVCVTMRDDSPDKPIPEQWGPDDHHARRLAQAVQREKELVAMSRAEIVERVIKDYEEARASYQESINNSAARKQRYEAMLAKVEAWTPPTADHVHLKQFMLDQLRESLRFDCGSSFEEPEMLSVDEWYNNQMIQVQRDIKYYTEQHQKEVEQTRSRNKWIADLRRSLA